jgi:predicted nucleotidyltransferase component of viral defense system
VIKGAEQLKAKIQQLTKGDSQKSQIYLRNFFMERYLERISESSYRDKFVLKGGMLVASLVGLDLRSTMDIDSTVKSLTLNEVEATKVIKETAEVPLDDSVSFVISKSLQIMGEHDYPGFRFLLQGRFDGIKQAIRIDLSTGDALTPQAIAYDYRLMFEDRSIKLLTYNLETILAEKIETMIARGTANTRMRDFYDVFILTQREEFDLSILREAILNTSRIRGTESLLSNHSQIMRGISESHIMETAWANFKRQSYFVGDLSWEEVVSVCFPLAEKVFSG